MDWGVFVYMNKFVIITSSELIRKVAERWKEQYFIYGQWETIRDLQEGGKISSKVVYDRLSQLNLDTASISEVDAAIGADGWATTTCNQCSRKCENVIRLGDEPDYDSSTVVICEDCLSKAVKVMKGSSL